MDWANESYVRLYVRDTKTWLMLGWEGQCILCLILRKLDRAGVLSDVFNADDLSVMLANGMPVQIVEIGLSRLVKKEVVTICDIGLLMPNYLTAQETPKTDKQRQKESRERRSVSSRIVTETSRGVTIESQERSEMSHPVTSGHASSQPVTLNLAGPCPALLANAVSKPSSTLPPLTSDRPSSATTPAPPPPEARPRASSRQDPMRRALEPKPDLVDQLFEAYRSESGLTGAQLDTQRQALFRRLAHEGVTVEQVRMVIRGAKLDDWARDTAKLAASPVLGSAEQREKYIAIARDPPKQKNAKAPPQPNDETNRYVPRVFGEPR